VNFGTVKVGKSKGRVAKLANTAKERTGRAVTFDGATVASNEFSISTNCDGSVGPKGKCSVGIGFAPTERRYSQPATASEPPICVFN
jgi:hypothetical protein